ncbi:nucleoside hydrolase [Ruania alba]|uniref:Purine nucleosidase n=1 Tax=Ruania alba TaxID=648782 RepID=A0A1H5MRF4_9MICO|nr:nucleoside hydrolase [Ruania alba]SEE91307.1 purine nucleosidase [Ruania alba]
MLLIDTDPGLDDAHALAIALARTDPADLALTTVAGNVGIDHVTRNAQRLVGTISPTVPIYVGASGPLLGNPVLAEHIHGADGFGGTPWDDSDLPPVHPQHAVQAILELADTHGEDLRIVALGPLTNLALAIRIDPTLPQRIGPVVAMGGTPSGLGNASINAEFNIYADPYAAEIVLATVPELTLITWDLALAVRFSRAEMAQMVAGSSPAAVAVRTLHEHRVATDAAYRDAADYGRCDPLAMAVALHPGVVTDAAHHAVVVGHDGGLGHGVTAVDWRDARTDRPRLTIPQTLDRTAVLDLLTL